VKTVVLVPGLYVNEILGKRWMILDPSRATPETWRLRIDVINERSINHGRQSPDLLVRETSRAHLPL
jgi:hypothetical protein